MKKNIHPDYHKIKVVMTDGTVSLKLDLLGVKKMIHLKLDIDPKVTFCLDRWNTKNFR